MFNDIVIIVTGSRHWNKPWRVHTILDSYMPRIVVEGNCPTGADLHARQWLRQHGLPTRSYTADWSLGNKGGPMRNARMLNDYCRHENALVIAFPVDGGRGTQDCVYQALELGMRVENYGDVQLW